jgi:mannose-1-phosphate guanylyltransferase
MITVIIAGGSGTRLWPLSTSKYPKHFLNLVDKNSLLQSAYKRARKLSRDVYVVTAGAEQLELVRQQLPELGDENIIVEPSRRDTAGCFVIALNHIQARHNHDEPIAFMHADHYIRDVAGYTYSFKVADKVSQQTGRIALVGIEPTYAATGFGYIQKDGLVEGSDFVHAVKMFVEKPDFDTAQDYLQSGEYLWNAGYFVGSVNTFLATMEAYAPELKANYDRMLQATDQASLEKTFLSFEKIAIDYALMEKAQNLVVVPASFDWMDIGSFGDAHKVSETDKHGNFKKGYVEIEGVENSYLRNEEDKPVAVIGLDNIVVVNTPHGVLVARKDLSQNVKSIATKVQEAAEKQQ